MNIKKIITTIAISAMVTTVSVISQANINSAKAASERRTSCNYAYNNMLSSTAEKELYNNFLKVCQTVDNDSTTTYKTTPNASYNDTNILPSQAAEIADLVIYDHPEFFWVDLQVNCTYDGGAKVNIAVASAYQSGSARAAAKSKIKAKANTYITQALKYSTPLGRAKYLHDALANDITYGGNESECQTISSAFINQKTVCAGYSRAYEYLCNAVGIDTIIVSGYEHEWNMIKVGAYWYCVDVTFDDVSPLSHQYFLCDYTSFQKNATNSNHKINSTTLPTYYKKYPSCTNTSKGANSLAFGDITGDSKVNSQDYSALNSYLSGTKQLSAENLAAADLDCNGKVNSDDLDILSKYINGNLKNLPYMSDDDVIVKVTVNQDYPYTGILGDVTGDSKVNSSDAVAVLISYARELTGISSTLNKDVSDVNGDGKINSTDAVWILKYYASFLIDSSLSGLEDFIKSN